MVVVTDVAVDIVAAVAVVVFVVVLVFVDCDDDDDDGDDVFVTSEDGTNGRVDISPKRGRSSADGGPSRP